MKNSFLILSFLLLGISGFSQNVGIGTTTPTRSLDVNGDFRITKTTDKTNAATHKSLLATDKNTGNVDYISIPSLDQSDAKNVEIAKTIYISNSPIDTKICSCGELSFYVKNSDNKPYFKLNSTESFDILNAGQTTPPITSFTIGYGTKTWIGTNYGYKDIIGKTFTIDNYNP